MLFKSVGLASLAALVADAACASATSSPRYVMYFDQ